MLRTLLVVFFVIAASGCSRFKGEAVSATSATPALMEDAAGKVVVLSFGYTSCPDVCPTALSRMKALYKALGPEAARVRMAFVTVDPDRDLPERLRDYVTAFDERIVPVRQSGRTLQQTLAAYGVVVKFRAERPNVPYAVDHTSGFLVIDSHGELRLRLSPELSEADMVADITRLLKDAPPASTLRIEKPVARVTPSGVGALYLNVVNASGAPDRLLRVETAVATNAELHETVQDGAVAKMLSRPEGFVVPASGSLELGPGGKHVMLFGVGGGSHDSVDATLVFERAGRMKATFSTAPTH